MIHYRDTGAPDSDVCPGKWFDENLMDGIVAFRGQFGFFRFGALRKYAAVLRAMASAGKIVNLVLGSNTTDPLTVQELREVVRVLAGNQDSHLTVVALGNPALFHPKVAHLVCPDGTARAIVGSANMTEPALGIHVEAWVEIASGVPASDRVLDDIVAAIDRWHAATEEGVFQVRTEAEVDNLLARGIVIDTAERRTRRAASAGATAQSRGRGRRRARWRPPVESAERGPEGEVETPVLTGAEEAAARPVGRIVLRWSKKLSRSDVNKNAKNVRNLMSLTKAGLMDDADFFRDVFFYGASWRAANITGHPSEIADVQFHVKLPRKRTRDLTLEVVHAPHRESGQHNYHTSIRWGPLGRQFRAARGDGYAKFWAVLEKHDTGEYSLTIAADEPSRRFIG